MLASSPPPVILVELFGLSPGELPDADVCARLDVAIQKAHAHLNGRVPPAYVSVEVSYDVDGAVEGVGFFDPFRNLLSCITVYHLDRDLDVPSLVGLPGALSLDEPARSQALTQLFSFKK